MKRVAYSIGAVVIFLVAAFLVLRIYSFLVTNPKVIEELKSNPAGERAQRVMIISLPDGRDLPVNYLWEGDKVFAGSDGRWWRTFDSEGSKVTLYIKGETLTGTAKAILDDPAYKKDIFSRLRNAPEWLPEWLDAVMVEITLDKP